MRKRATWFLVAAAAFFLSTQGCKKSQPQAATQDRYGIGIDWPRLETEFRDNDPVIQASAASIKRCILYHQFSQAIADLEKLAGNPALTEPQRKMLSDLRAQTQHVMAKASPPQPAQ